MNLDNKNLELHSLPFSISDTMELTTTHAGNIKIFHEGHSYIKQKPRKTTIHWECSERKIQKCTGKLITDIKVRIINYYIISNII